MMLGEIPISMLSEDWVSNNTWAYFVFDLLQGIILNTHTHFLSFNIEEVLALLMWVVEYVDTWMIHQ